MPESPNAENRVLLELLETAADLSAYGLVTEAAIAQIEAFCAPSRAIENAP